MIRAALLTLCNFTRRHATLGGALAIALHWAGDLYRTLHHSQQGLYSGLHMTWQAMFPGVLGRNLSITTDRRSAANAVDTSFVGLEGVLNGISDAMFGKRIKAIVVENQPMPIYGGAAYAIDGLLTDVFTPKLSGRCRYTLTPT